MKSVSSSSLTLPMIKSNVSLVSDKSLRLVLTTAGSPNFWLNITSSTDGGFVLLKYPRSQCLYSYGFDFGNPESRLRVPFSCDLRPSSETCRNYHNQWFTLILNFIDHTVSHIVQYYDILLVVALQTSTVTLYLL